MSDRTWGRVQTLIINAVELAKCGNGHHVYSTGYSTAKRDVLIEIAKAFEELDADMQALMRDAARYRWLRDYNEEEFARGGEDLDKLCDAGINEKLPTEIRMPQYILDTDRRSIERRMGWQKFEAYMAEYCRASLIKGGMNAFFRKHGTSQTVMSQLTRRCVNRLTVHERKIWAKHTKNCTNFANEQRIGLRIWLEGKGIYVSEEKLS